MSLVKPGPQGGGSGAFALSPTLEKKVKSILQNLQLHH